MKARIRLIDANKLQTTTTYFGISDTPVEVVKKSVIDNAKTVEAVPLSVIEKIHDAIDNADSDDFFEDEHGYIIDSTLTIEHIHEIISKVVKECTHE